MRVRFGAMLAMAAMLSGCGGSGEGSVSTGGSTPSPTPTASAGCSLRERQDWAAAQLREWYLFPDTLPANLSPTPYTTVDDYIDALTATARAQRKDRYFTYLTSIKEENAYYESGSSAGFGFRLGLDTTNRLYVIESFEGAPALAAGLDRGTEIVAVGTTTANLRTVSAIMTAGRRHWDRTPSAQRASSGSPTPPVRAPSRSRSPTSRSSRFLRATARRSSTMADGASATSTCAPSSRPPTRRCARHSRASVRRASPTSSSTCATMAAGWSRRPN
jgi:hypothetical protein